MRILNKFAIFIIAMLPTLSGYAQITIGSGSQPNKGSLLDLRQKEGTSVELSTADKGLALPRVALTEEDKLFPMFSDDPEYIANGNNKKTEQDMLHTGLVVYNTNKCGILGTGVYLWTENKWIKLGHNQTPLGLNLSEDILYLGSGTALQPLTTQTATISWNPHDLAVTPPTFPASPIAGFTSFTPASLVDMTSPQTLSFLPEPIPPATITGDPFVSVTKYVAFTFDACGTETKTLTINQTNKALLLTTPALVNTTTTGPLNSSIASNAKWTLGVSPAFNTAISNISPTIGATQGSELYGGSNSASIGYTVTPNNLNSRYNYITFSDAESPKRFNDVVLTVGQYQPTTEPTMEQYRDRWHAIYGNGSPTELLGQDGDITRNINRVQWHRDQNNNIFFSALFGNERWMITNLAATTYASGVASPPVISRSGASSTTDAYWQYPNNDANPTNQRFGLLYNWSAATANKNPSIGNQIGEVHAQYQGICPNGWHLPSEKEWADFAAIVAADPLKYSINPTGGDVAYTLKDISQAAAFSGKAFGLLEGGFNAMLVGDVTGGNVNAYGTRAYFRTSSSHVGQGNTAQGNPVPVLNAWVKAIIFDNPALAGGYTDGGRGNLFSVRCKKN